MKVWAWKTLKHLDLRGMTSLFKDLTDGRHSELRRDV